MEITGIIRHALEVRRGVSQRTGNPWASRDYIMEIPNGQYEPKHFVFTVFGEERLKQFALKKDEEVTVSFDIDAKEYNGKWYNNVQAYDIVRGGVSANTQQGQSAPAQASAPQPAQAAVQAPIFDAPEGGGAYADDLPF